MGSWDGTRGIEVVVLTDGEVWELEETVAFVEKSLKGGEGGKRPVRYFRLGISDAVLRALVEGIAEAGGGYAEIIPNVTEGGWEERLVTVLEAALTGYCGRVEVEVEGVVKRSPMVLTSLKNVSAVSPFVRSRIFYLFEGVMAESAKSVTLKTTDASGNEIRTVIPVRLLHDKDIKLHRFAVRALLGDLERRLHEIRNPERSGYYYARSTSSREILSIKQEGERLGCKWSLTSKWTSFVALEEQEEGAAAGKEVGTAKTDTDDLGLLRPRNKEKQKLLVAAALGTAGAFSDVLKLRAQTIRDTLSTGVDPGSDPVSDQDTSQDESEGEEESPGEATAGYLDAPLPSSWDALDQSYGSLQDYLCATPPPPPAAQAPQPIVLPRSRTALTWLSSPTPMASQSIRRGAEVDDALAKSSPLSSAMDELYGALQEQEPADEMEGPPRRASPSPNKLLMVDSGSRRAVSGMLSRMAAELSGGEPPLASARGPAYAYSWPESGDSDTDTRGGMHHFSVPAPASAPRPKMFFGMPKSAAPHSRSSSSPNTASGMKRSADRSSPHQALAPSIGNSPRIDTTEEGSSGDANDMPVHLAARSSSAAPLSFGQLPLTSSSRPAAAEVSKSRHPPSSSARSATRAATRGDTWRGAPRSLSRPTRPRSPSPIRAGNDPILYHPNRSETVRNFEDNNESSVPCEGVSVSVSVTVEKISAIFQKFSGEFSSFGKESSTSEDGSKPETDVEPTTDTTGSPPATSSAREDTNTTSSTPIAPNTPPKPEAKPGKQTVAPVESPAPGTGAVKAPTSNTVSAPQPPKMNTPDMPTPPTIPPRAARAFIKKIIQYQPSNGAFIFPSGSEIKTVLGPEFYTKVKAEMPADTPLTISVTVMLVALLEAQFDSCRGLWVLVVEKAKGFVAAESKVAGVDVEGLWENARGVVAGMSILDLEEDGSLRRRRDSAEGVELLFAPWCDE